MPIFHMWRSAFFSLPCETDDFSSKHEAIEWIESIMEEVAEKQGD
jgi:hypothetical protein